MVDSLGEYGYNFQIKLIAALLSDQAFLQQILDILDIEFFDSEANQEIIKIIKDYFEAYRQIPTLDALKVKFTNIENDVLRIAMIEHIKDVWRNLNSSDLEFVKTESLNFCKNQKLKSAILDSVELLKARDYDAIKNKIDEAMRAGAEQRIGHDYLVDIHLRYKTTTRNCVETRWSVINEIMDGGLSAGELGVIMGGPGSGKSWALQSLASHALQKGLKVIYYTLELDEEYTGRRFDALLTGIPFQNLRYHLEEVEERLKYINKGQLFINYFPEYSITANGLKTHIEKYIFRGIKPDVVVLDYADCLKPIILGRRDRPDQISGDIYTMLKGIAGELQIPIWTASQANRCLSINTIVKHKEKGDIKIIDLSVGDSILTAEGYKKVSNIYPIEKQAVYRIKLKNGKEILCSSKHEFPLSCGTQKSIMSGLSIGDKLLVRKTKSTNFIPDEIDLIEYVGKQDTIDITVEDTHMFYANDIYTHNSAAELEIIQGHNVADSYIKIMKADFIVSISRKVEDKIAGTGRWHIIKNRFGPDGITFPSKINFSTGHIEIFEPASIEGKDTQKMMDNGNEYARKYLATKFRTLNNDNNKDT